MSFNEIALVVLGASGLVRLVLDVLQDILIKVKDVIKAWRAVRREIRKSASDEGEHGPELHR